MARYQIVSRLLTVAGQLEIQGPSDIFRFLDAIDLSGGVVPTAKVSVYSVGDGFNGDALPVRLGQGFKARDTKRWIVSWTAQPGVTATFGTSAGAGDVDWDADSPIVVAFPSATVETLNNQSFLGSASQAALAANFSHAQIFNPASSGKLVIIDRAFPTCVAATPNILGGLFNTAMTTDAGANVKANKNSGAVAPVAQMRGQTNGTQLGTVYPVTLRNICVDFVVFDPPIVLEAGEGFHFVPTAVNVDMSCAFQWREKDGP